MLLKLRGPENCWRLLSMKPQSQTGIVLNAARKWMDPSDNAGVVGNCVLRNPLSSE